MGLERKRKRKLVIPPEEARKAQAPESVGVATEVAVGQSEWVLPSPLSEVVSSTLEASPSRKTRLSSL